MVGRGYAGNPPGRHYLHVLPGGAIMLSSGTTLGGQVRKRTEYRIVGVELTDDNIEEIRDFAHLSLHFVAGDVIELDIDLEGIVADEVATASLRMFAQRWGGTPKQRTVETVTSDWAEV